MSRRDQLLWRIAKETPAFGADDLSGGGARITGGRWNSKGNAVVYAAPSAALDVLETLAHLGDNIAIRNAFLIRIVVPAAVWRRREIVEAHRLEPTWTAEPPGSTSIAFGDAWLGAGTGALLMVPSVIVPEEHNVLINPAHPDAGKITAHVARQYIYDPRLGLPAAHAGGPLR